MCPGAVAAVLAGMSAGSTLETSRPGRWATLLAFLVAVESRGRMNPRAFPTVFSHALAEVAVSLIAAVISVGTFFVLRAQVLKRASVANAR